MTIGTAEPGAGAGEGAGASGHGRARPRLIRAPLPAGLATHLVGALVLVAAAELSRSFWVTGSEVALIWPPAGIALGLAVTFGARVLPAMALALLAWGLLTREALGVLWLLPAGGLALGGALAATILRRLHARGRLESPVRELLAFWGVGLAVSAGVSVPLGALALALQPGFSASYGPFAIGAAYWISEAFGILVFGALAARLGAALAGHRLVEAIRPERWQLAWLGALLLLAGTQVTVGRSATPEFGAPMVYLYFPLLAVAAGLGTALFQDLVAAVVATGVVSAALIGAGGLEIPRDNFEVIEIVLLVSAFSVMTQLVSAMATALRHHLARANELARRDYLTGLYNERELAARLEETRGGAVALLDVPAVRHALDLAGLHRTNELERMVSARLAGRVDDPLMLARVGRGLYAVHCGDGAAPALERTVGGCYDALDGLRIREGSVRFTLDPACGVVRLDDASGRDDSMAMAGQALREARADGDRRIRVRSADPVALDSARADQDLAERLRSALRSPDGFLLYAQPVVPLDAGGGRRPFLELLLRLPRAEGEPLTPGAFLDVAARHGLMHELDRWVMDHALALSTQTRFGVSVNISGPTLGDPELVAWLDQRRRAHGATAGDLCIEVTETEPVRTLAAASGVTAELRAAGYGVALDDFGTGLASFEYLRAFAFDLVKIDGSFVRAASSPTERAMVEAIQRVAATAGLPTTAEFVEDAATRDWLASIGIDYGQGFLFGRPQPFARAVADLDAGCGRDRR